MKLSKNQNGIISLFLLGMPILALIVGIFVYVVVIKKDGLIKQAPNKLKTLAEANLSEKKLDGIKWERHYGLHGLLLAHKVKSGDYPASSNKGWQDFIKDRSSNETLIDPYTKTAYKFTAKDPGYGEIQYKYPASCDNKRKNFIAANSSQSYAFRLKYSDGIRCSHSL